MNIFKFIKEILNIRRLNTLEHYWDILAQLERELRRLESYPEPSKIALHVQSCKIDIESVNQKIFKLKSKF